VGPPILLDLPGHGRHAGDVAPWRHSLGAVDGEITALGQEEPLDLVGYSMGARLALAYAVRNPERVRRLVLESGSPGLDDPVAREVRREADEALARRIERDGIEAFVHHWEGLPLFESQRALPPEVRQARRAARMHNHPGSLAASLRGLGTGSVPSVWGSLADLRVPVLILVGGLDRKFTDIGRRMAAALPEAVLTVVPDAGHAVHMERPGAWLGAVVPFLAPGDG
jgi:2-succinyl-6-hydroxy-2,4-cyclohexadiene-1-carboxylate synthase